MKIELGINTCFALKRWPRPEDWIPIVRSLDLPIVQHTFDLVRSYASEASAKALAEACSAHDLRLHSTFTGLAAYNQNLLLSPSSRGRASAQRWFDWAIRYSASAGCEATGGHVGAMSVPDWNSAERRAAQWDGLRRSLGELAETTRAQGLAYLMVENLASEREPSTMAMIEGLVTDGDAHRAPIRLCLDVGHMCVPGTEGADRDPLAWIARFGRVASVIQLQQSSDEGDHHWPFTPEYNALGRIDADRILASLAETGVGHATLIFEIIPPAERSDTQVIDDLHMSVEYWRKASLDTAYRELQRRFAPWNRLDLL